MNSPVEDRLREALAEAGATVDTSTLRPLTTQERRRLRVDFRMLAAAAAVVAVGSATAVVVGGGAGGDGGQTMAVASEVFSRAEADLSVFLCTESAPKEAGCAGAVTSEQRAAIERVLAERTPPIAAVQWVSQESAYADFRERFTHSLPLQAAVKATDLPPSYQLKLDHGADRRQVMAAFHGLAGVSFVSDHAADPSTGTSAQGRERYDMSVFLCKKDTALAACGAKRGDGKIREGGKAITAAQKRSLEGLIGKLPEVEEYVFEDQEAAYENFREAYKNNKTILEATRPEDMPESYRIKLKKDAPWREVLADLERQPGVAQVANHGCLLDRYSLIADFGLTLPESTVCPEGK